MTLFNSRIADSFLPCHEDVLISFKTDIFLTRKSSSLLCVKWRSSLTYWETEDVQDATPLHVRCTILCERTTVLVGVFVTDDNLNFTTTLKAWSDRIIIELHEGRPQIGTLLRFVVASVCPQSLCWAHVLPSTSLFNLDFSKSTQTLWKWEREDRQTACV